MLKISELRGKSEEELLAEIERIKAESYKKREELITGKDKNTGPLKALKKDLARIRTVVREKEILKEIEGKL